MTIKRKKQKRYFYHFLGQMYFLRNSYIRQPNCVSEYMDFEIDLTIYVLELTVIIC